MLSLNKRANKMYRAAFKCTVNRLVGLVMIAGLYFFVALKCGALPSSPSLSAAQRVEIEKCIELTNKMVFDIYNDGEINDKDYAIIFCIEYPGSRVIINNNPTTGMSHLFNAVPVEGGWLYIEPQKNPKGPLMADVWGKMYNPAFNKEPTMILLIAMVDCIFGGYTDTPEQINYRNKALKIIGDKIKSH